LSLIQNKKRIIQIPSFTGFYDNPLVNYRLLK
jgi:hypothetical protein